MARKSSVKLDNPRAKFYSAYIYIGEGIFQKSICTNRGKKSGKCYAWEVSKLDISKPEDEEFIKSSMILIGESEL